MIGALNSINIILRLIPLFYTKQIIGSNYYYTGRVKKCKMPYNLVTFYNTLRLYYCTQVKICVYYKLVLSVAVDLGVEDDDEEPVPLPNVNAAILRKVIAWCTYHKDDPPPPEDDENKEKRTDDICSWDAEFLKVDQGTLFELILVRHSVYCISKLIWELSLNRFL